MTTFVRFVDWPVTPGDNIIVVCQPHDAPTLALGPGSRFCEAGGAICVVKDKATKAEKYRINLDAISRAGLKVRLPLLRHQKSAKSNLE